MMKKPQLTIRLQLLVIVGILNILITLLVATGVYNSWANYTQAQRLNSASSIIDELYTANRNLSLERASSLAVLYAPLDSDTNLQADLVNIRRNTDKTLDIALGLSNIPQSKVTQELANIRSLYETLQVQRSTIDAIITFPVAQRDFTVATQFFQTSSALIDNMQNFILVYSGQYQNINPIINQHLYFKHLVWALAENIGQEYAIIGQLIAENKAPTPTQRKQLSSLNGHIEYGWEMLRKLSSNNELAQKLSPYVEEANTQYFFIFEQISELLDENLAENTAVYPISTEMWLGLSAQVVDSLLVLQDEILKETKIQVHVVESQAKRRIIISLLIFMAALLLSFYCWHIIVFKVTKPINTMINTLYKASHKDVNAPEAYDPDEISKLSRVLQAFQENTHKIKQSNEELERFAFIAAHDLKTPLRAVDTISEWLEEDLNESLPEKSRKHFSELRNRIKLMDKLLDDTLEYARIDAKVKNKQGQIINGKDLITEIVTLINVPSEFTITISEKMEKAFFPKFPLQQVLYNLIHNAVIHHDKNTGRINIEMDENDSRYTFSVRDDGPGIDEKYHHKIFEMFQTLQSRNKSKGRGMGLAIVRKIVTTYGGSIDLQSAPGQGSMFYFTWPKLQSHDTIGQQYSDDRREYA